MFAPVRINRPNAGIRLQPLHKSLYKVPIFDNKVRINPALQHVNILSRKLSSIPSQRSRVFAREEERFPLISKQENSSITRREPGANRNTAHAVPRNQRQGNLFSAPQPAGKSIVRHLPVVAQNISTGSKSPTKYSNKNQNDSKVIVSQIAGVSSKEHEVQILRTEKMASAWAAARVEHAIPNLRDSGEHGKVGGEHSIGNSSTAMSKYQKDKTPTGRNTTDQVDSVDNNHDTSTTNAQSDKRGSKQSHVKNSTENIAESTGGTNDQSPHKKVYKQSSKASYVKSKGSSGYGSMSSNSQHGQTTADNKYSIFKPSSHADSVIGSGKAKVLSSVYQSKVKVEQSQNKTGVHLAEQEAILSEREAGMYVHLKSTYKQAAEQERERRKENFFKKLQDIQIESALQHNRAVRNKTAKKEQAKKRQLEQLAHIRNKFEEDRQRRYKSQYVTKNFLNYERMNRGEFGLPENFTTKTHYNAKLRPGGGKVTAVDFIKREVKLKKNYSKMFAKPAMGRKASVSEPRMEGKDKVTLEVFDAEGNPIKGKRVDVKTALQEAQDMLNNMEQEGDQDTATSDISKTQPKKNSTAKTQPVEKSKTKAKPVVSVHVEKPKESKTSPLKPSTTASTEHKPEAAKATTNTLKLPADPPPAETSHSRKPVMDSLSINSRISVITEESETGEDFYEQLMAKYGIELSDDDDD